jgi:EmrB/QacA subfamily drug resistance transporter
MGLAVVVICNDFSAINVALPTMTREFDVSVDSIQWVVNAFTLTFGVLIVTGGRLADKFGRRRVFFAGAVIFAGSSLLGGFAPDEVWLIACRALMGVGGALVWPAVVGITYSLLPSDRAGMAGGIILGAAGLGNVLGPLLGGILTDAWSWRGIFFVNVPVAVIAIVVVGFLVAPDRPEREEGRLDYPGMVFLTTALVALLLLLDLAPRWGWQDPRSILLALVALLSGGALWRIERRAGERALVPREMLASPSFAGACLAIFFVSAAFFSALLYLPLFMQRQLGYSALEAGVGMLPLLATFGLVSFAVGVLYHRVGARPLVVLGAASVCAGSVACSLVESNSGYWALVPGMVGLGIGLGCFYPTATTAGVTAVILSRASLAGGVFYMFETVGGSIGLALSTAFFEGATPPFVAGIRAAFQADALVSSAAILAGLLLVGRQSWHRTAPRRHPA